MKNSISRTLRSLLPERLLLPSLLFAAYPASTLTQKWKFGASLKSKLPVDDKRRPIPWTPYWLTELLSERVPADAKTMEFGSGASTSFFSRLCCQVVAIEHDPSWAAHVQAVSSPNVRIIEVSSDLDGYLKPFSEITECPDLVFVDGIFRVECVRAGLACVSARGVVLLDDSQRADYLAAFEEARRRGFRALKIWGHKPGSINLHQAAIFYRDGNLLNI